MSPLAQGITRNPALQSSRGTRLPSLHQPHLSNLMTILKDRSCHGPQFTKKRCSGSKRAEPVWQLIGVGIFNPAHPHLQEGLETELTYVTSGRLQPTHVMKPQTKPETSRLGGFQAGDYALARPDATGAETSAPATLPSHHTPTQILLPCTSLHLVALYLF